LSLVKNAIVEVGLTSEVGNALTWTIVVVHDRKDFLIARLEFCDGHGGILTEKLGLPDDSGVPLPSWGMMKHSLQAIRSSY